jgi:hypothetical protein
MVLLPLDFESSASASSAIPAKAIKKKSLPYSSQRHSAYHPLPFKPMHPENKLIAFATEKRY